MCATRAIRGLPAPKTAHVVADVDARADARDGPRRAFPVDGTRERGAMSFRPGSKASERKKGFKKAIDARESIDANDDVVARARARFVRGARRQRAREGDERGAQVEGDLAAARSRMTTDARVTRGIVRGGR